MMWGAFSSPFATYRPTKTKIDQHQSTTRPRNQPTNQPTNHPTNQPTTPPTDQSNPLQASTPRTWEETDMAVATYFWSNISATISHGIGPVVCLYTYIMYYIYVDTIYIW
jgi:hypothetical protein